MSQMLDITTPSKSIFSEGAHLTEPPRRAFCFLHSKRSARQKVNSLQPPTQFSSETTLKILTPWFLKKLVDRHDIL